MSKPKILDDGYPQAGEKLFSTNSPNWLLNAHVRPLRSQDAAWDYYIEGYKIIAELGLQRLREEHFDRDKLVFPIVFNYRHHFELCLKAIIVFGNKLFDTTFKFPGHHQLPALWKEARALIESRWKGGADLDAVEAQIKELAQFDPGSFTYRYPVAKDGETSSHPEHDPNKPNERFTMLNIENFCEKAARLSKFLGSCAYGLWCELSEKEDWESEIRSWSE